MSLPEYRNLTQSELEWADHCAETGNTSALRDLQELSANRVGRSAKNTDAYCNPIRLIKIE
tara:strand:- start:1205 stop:1387 length:183 start_codon:yes stop_codon:yes gene_type:complete